jgi:hypothetical protein
MAVGIRWAEHATYSARKSWHCLRRMWRSMGRHSHEVCSVFSLALGASVDWCSRFGLGDRRMRLPATQPRNVPVLCHFMFLEATIRQLHVNALYIHKLECHNKLICQDCNHYFTCKICGFYCSKYEECRLLGYKNPFRTSQGHITSPLQIPAC